LRNLEDYEDSPQQATGYQKEDSSEPARSELRGISPKEIEGLSRPGTHTILGDVTVLELKKENDSDEQLIVSVIVSVKVKNFLFDTMTHLQHHQGEYQR
jgi:tRNA G37 N-methylase Trm5